MYYISNADFKNYKVFETPSIVEARAIAVKMIEKYPKATFWGIYTDKKANGKPHSTVVFYGTPAGYGWLHDSSAPKMILKNGKLRQNTTDFKKYTADGFPIYKIWRYWNSDDGHVVLAKHPETKEWVFGRNYNIKTGRWAGGTYRIRIEDLYERCPPYGKLIVNNKRGPTGKY